VFVDVGMVPGFVDEALEIDVEGCVVGGVGNCVRSVLEMYESGVKFMVGGDWLVVAETESAFVGTGEGRATLGRAGVEDLA